MTANKLVRLVNAHVAANKPHAGVKCIITSVKQETPK